MKTLFYFFQKQNSTGQKKLVVFRMKTTTRATPLPELSQGTMWKFDFILHFQMIAFGTSGAC